MKIVHCVGWYFPEFLGGSEIYVQRLGRELQKLGHEVAVLAPRDGHSAERYAHEGLEVWRYPVPEQRTQAQHAGELPHARFEVFEQQLRELRGDVFHLHSFTYGAGLHHLRAARALKLATVVTVHTPSLMCARGTMMRYGREACDGRIEVARCAPCWLATRGLSPALAEPAARLLSALPDELYRVAPGRSRALLSTPARISRARAALLELAGHADRVIAVCRWLHDALRINGVPESKLVLSRQGMPATLAAHERGPLPDTRPSPVLRVGYFGRGAREKGVDVLVRAVRDLAPATALELRVHAVTNTREDRDYMTQVRSLAGSDARIAFVPPVPRDAVQQAMRGCDVVAIPSRWLETGPLVAMEALAAGVPVLGSDLGGLAELVEPGVTGWLLPVDDVARWSAQLAKLAEPGAARLCWPAEHVRFESEAGVAAQMAALYERVDAARRERS